MFTGAANETVACQLAAVVTTFVGSCGTVAGTTALDAELNDPVPIAFLAATVNVYDTPFVKPGTVIGLPDQVTITPPVLDVTI